MPTRAARGVIVVRTFKQRGKSGFGTFPRADDFTGNLIGGQRSRRNYDDHRLAVGNGFVRFLEVIRARGAVPFVIPAAIALRFQARGDFVGHGAIFLHVADENLFGQRSHPGLRAEMPKSSALPSGAYSLLPRKKIANPNATAHGRCRAKDASLAEHAARKVLSGFGRHAINKCLARSWSECGIRIVVVRDLAKVEARVRFPYPAPLCNE